jgi:hypothetical protein
MDQPTPVRPVARLVRGWLAAFLSTSLAGLSHCAAGASTPNPVLLLIAVAVAGVVCVVLAGHRMGPSRIGAAVLVSQGAYHALFSVPALAPCAVRGGWAIDHAHHGTAGMPTVSALDPAACLTPVVEGHSPMVAAHLLAAAATFCVLRHGETSWWALVDALTPRLTQVLALVLPLIPAKRPVRRSGQFSHRELHDTGWVRAAISRRGPPVPVV